MLEYSACHVPSVADKLAGGVHSAIDSGEPIEFNTPY